ncbi:unnamed protein product [Periconia digitata]|uniref:YTH domain-containing protein n=1 Tax=Periconia digitata TaxID=1303443 RepID=A0A9W4UVS5_9PLEO|nr:unnamed protein product [Periconia digitata]
MAYVWVQQWVALPLILENQMGDIPQGSSSQALDPTTATAAPDTHHGSSTPSSSNAKSLPNNPPFYSQLSSIPQAQPRSDMRASPYPPSQHYPDQTPSTMMNMGAMAGALPDYATHDSGAHALPPQGQRHLSGASTAAMVYQLQQNMQLPGPASGSIPTQHPYGPGFAPGQFHPNFSPSPGPQHGNYAAFPAGQPRMQATASMPGPYQHFPHQPSQYMYYPSPYGPQMQYAPAMPGHNTQGQPMYGRRPSVPGAHGPGPGSMDMPQQDAGYAANRMNNNATMGDSGVMANMYGGPFIHQQGIPRSGTSSSIPRGPPRKPKQSGHALWVGNLPPGTTVIALKDHFSRDATKEIESLFLISKSNCAFVNYRTEASCTAAMHRFHDSRFNGVRLVCRLRRSSAATSGVPTGPSAMVGARTSSASAPHSPLEVEEQESAQVEAEATPQESHEESKSPVVISPKKYFIVKSLTLQDLELSVRNGIWATQSHNEETLNKAFESAENVYLIFSANKSGEYFGYARMASSILENAGDITGSAPKPENILESPDVPKSIPTAATEFAPKGRIIDDSARGTIFWEAELTDSEEDEGVESAEKEKEEAQPQSQEGDGDAPAVSQSWGKPFRIEWISTNRLPFYRTRGLRNPWNANREVKIARDGTELEPAVGERLVQMFHRLGPSNAPGGPLPPPQVVMQAPALGGPHMPPY